MSCRAEGDRPKTLIRNRIGRTAPWLASPIHRVVGRRVPWRRSARRPRRPRAPAALDLADDKVRRVMFHEITERAVKEAFQRTSPINMDMVNAQQARRFLDRFVGYQLSPLLWSKVARNLSAGRVQSVAVRLIVDREKEIRAFVSEEYWKITASLSPAGSTTEADRFEA